MPPIESIPYGFLQSQFGTFDIECASRLTGAPFTCANQIPQDEEWPPWVVDVGEPLGFRGGTSESWENSAEVSARRGSVMGFGVSCFEMCAIECLVQPLDRHHVGLIACRVATGSWIPVIVNNDPARRCRTRASAHDGADGQVTVLFDDPDVISRVRWVATTCGIPGIIDFDPAGWNLASADCFGWGYLREASAYGVCGGPEAKCAERECTTKSDGDVFHWANCSGCGFPERIKAPYSILIKYIIR